MRTDRKYLFLGIILLITLVSYWPVLQNHAFVWDDEGYVVNNPLLKSIRFDEIFTRNVMGNYHPVTVLVLAVEHYFFGLNATAFHIVNLLFHLINVLLVFYVVNLLTEKHMASLAAALLFGAHPMLTEAVAWISGIKDLLCTTFFLFSWIFYILYLKNLQKKFILLTFMFFLLSVLSKATAVSLPLVLLLTDYYEGRKLNFKVWTEKIPFFLLSLLFGIMAVKEQESTGNLSVHDFSVLQQISFAGLGLFTYLIKLIIPFKLSAFHPYPDFRSVFFLFPFLTILTAGSVIFSLRKTKKIVFGTGFFLITLFFVLQWLPVGKAIMAERYIYLPSVGIVMLAGMGFEKLVTTRKTRTLATGMLLVFTLFFSLKTFSRTKIWKDEVTLWTDVISKYDHVPVAFLNRGIAFAQSGRLNYALDDFNRALQLDNEYPKAWFNRGNIHMRINQPENALKDYNKAIELNPNYGPAYYNRGNLYMDREQYDLAIADFSNSLRFDPGNVMAYTNRGTSYSRKGDYDKALQDLKAATRLNPNDPETYFQLGMVYGLIKNYAEAIASFSVTLRFQPGDAEACYYRGLAAYHSGKKEEAMNDFRESARLGFQPARDLLTQLAEQVRF